MIFLFSVLEWGTFFKNLHSCVVVANMACNYLLNAIIWNLNENFKTLCESIVVQILFSLVHRKHQKEPFKNKYARPLLKNKSTELHSGTEQRITAASAAAAFFEFRASRYYAKHLSNTRINHEERSSPGTYEISRATPKKQQQQRLRNTVVCALHTGARAYVSRTYIAAHKFSSKIREGSEGERTGVVRPGRATQRRDSSRERDEGSQSRRRSNEFAR